MADVDIIDQAAHDVVDLDSSGAAGAVAGVTITGGNQTAPAGTPLALSASVQGTGVSQTVLWTRTGHGAIDILTGVYSPPAAGKYDKVSVVKAYSAQDPSQFAIVLITTPALAVATGTLSASYPVVWNWTPVAGATAYTLYRNGVSVYTGAALTFTDTVPAGQSATYTYTATVGGVEGPPSLPQTIVVPGHSVNSV